MFGKTRPVTRPLRIEHPDRLFFITNRTVSEEYWLAPLVASLALPRNRQQRFALRVYEQRTNRQLERWLRRGSLRRGAFQPAFTTAQAVRILRDLVGSILARAQERHGVEIFAICVMSNHFHLVARSRAMRLAPFMRDFKSQLARSLNTLFGRSGPLWGRRYDCLPILDDPSSLDRVLYTLDNPMKAGLVASLDQWPGLTLASGLAPPAVPFEYFDKMAWHSARRPKELEPFFKRATLVLSPLPIFQRSTDDAIRRALQHHLRERKRRRASDAGASVPQGLDRLASTPLGFRPLSPGKRRRPPCFSFSAELRAEHLRQRRHVHREYAASNDRLRRLAGAVLFPQGTYRPPAVVALDAG